MNLSLDQLQSVLPSISLEKYRSIDGLDTNEFFNKHGDQHYKLLAYLSTLFDGKDIFDIGTHMGSSATALSYNPANTVHTFDIQNGRLNKTSQGPTSISNIQFHLCDLMRDDTRSPWADRLLASPLIFLDIDPHEGTMEYEFYQWLRDNHFQGLLVLDDIWYFKGMRDNLWHKIPGFYKHDLTQVGHWSGSAVISFNKDQIASWKPDLPRDKSWTLVTAYYDLTKMTDASVDICKRPADHYLSTAAATLATDQNLVIYCEAETLDTLKTLRPDWLAAKTRYVVKSFDEFPMTQYRAKIIENRRTHPYHFDNRNTASYYLFCMARCAMLKEVIQANTFGSTHFAWINICIERMGYKNLVYLEEALQQFRDKFSTCYIDYLSPQLIANLPEYFLWGRCSMCSGFYTGNTEYMYKVCDLLEKKFLHFLALGYGHADEQLFSPVYFENKDLFDVYLGDYHQMITNYTLVRDECWRPVRQVLQNAYNQRDFETALLICRIYSRSLFTGTAIIDDATFVHYIKMYISIALTNSLEDMAVIKQLCEKRKIPFSSIV